MFFLSIQSCCIFFLLKQWKCTNLSWVDLFSRKYFFFKLSLMRKDLYIECAIVFHLFHAICSMITQLFFIDVVCWVKTLVSSPFMQCSLFLRDWACIFLCEIFVSFVSGLHWWTVADMIMNDYIGEVESVNSLDEKSSSSSSMMSHLLNLKLLVLIMNHLRNLKLILAVILILNFMIDQSLLKNVLLETIL